MSSEESFCIFPPYLAFYEESLRSRITAALDSVEIANKLIFLHEDHLKSLPSDWRTILLDQMQNIIVQSASISKFFWPPRDGKESLHKKRGKYLRELYKIQPNSPLKSRILRDYLEHFDEKLDNYLQIPIFGHIFPEFVGTTEHDDVQQHIFRGYYLDSGIFQVLDEKIEMNSLVEEIVRLDDVLNNRKEKA